MKRIFNNNWKFAEFELDKSMEEMIEADSFKAVDIPHDWMIYHVKDLYKDSIGFYRKTFCVNVEESKEYILRFEGVYMDCSVYLNAEKIYEWKYGYSTFDVVLTDSLKSGENEIWVVCKYQSPNTRWYSGAGIYRNVYFYELEAEHIPLDGCYISASNLAGDDFMLSIDCEVVSKIPSDGLLVHRILAADGSLAAQMEDYVPLCPEVYVSKQSQEIKNVHRWDIDDPYLYTVETTLYVNDEVKDRVTNPLGFRTIRFDNNKGFFINERNVKINGVCQHHDLGALGAAMNEAALKRQLVMLKKMGANSIRTSHNMPAKELMVLADKMGFLICSEAFDMWERPKTTFDYGNYFPTWWKKDITSWVRRDRNHPSMIIWSIGNEIYDTHAGNGYKWTILLSDATRELDYRHNAYIGIGSNYIAWEGAQKCAQKLELSGYNYGEKLYDEHHEKLFPHWCIFGSETASTVQSRGIYHFPIEKRLLTYEDRQCSSLGNCSTNWGAVNSDTVIADHRDRDFVAGQYIWTGWDYIGEPTPYFSKNSFFGQIDTAGFPKDTYYMYQAEWTSAKNNPMVHLLPYWDYNQGQIIDVCAYSNLPTVELFLNGKSLGKQNIDHEHGRVLHCHWKVPYEEGQIKAVAYDANGNEAASDFQTSFDSGVRIVMGTENRKILANGKDLAFFEIGIVDESSRRVENARDRIKVVVEGPGRLVGLDNGDSTDYEEYKGDCRKLFSGSLLAIVASTNEPGKISVSAYGGDLLDPAYVEIESLPCEVDEGECCSDKNYEVSYTEDVSIRKIILSCEGSRKLDANHKEAYVDYIIEPSDTTYSDVYFKALTYDAIEAGFVKVDSEGSRVKITAIGDGDFKLTAFANNGKDHAEVISELEFSISGLGKALLDPYGFVAGIEVSDCSHPTKLSFEGGVFVDTNEECFLRYDNIDFGLYGSDEITLPIFSFDNEIPLEIWEGEYGKGTKLCEDIYKAQSIYNTYQARTFKLSRRISGVKTISLFFGSIGRFSLKGFSFAKIDKTYDRLLAIDNSRITGDSFTVNEDSITNIGNNVTIEYEDMDFSQRGVSSITVMGRSNNEKTSMHILLTNGDDTLREMIEIPYSQDYKETTVEIGNITITGKASLLFLPGSNFDLKWIKFNKNS